MENSIELVRKAEMEADGILQAAQTQAGKILADAREAAAQQTQAARQNAEETAASRVAVAQSKSREALAADAASLEGEMQALKEAARGRQPQAIQQILASLA